MIGRNPIESRFQQNALFDACGNWVSAVIGEANAGASEILVIELMVALGTGDARNLDRVGKVDEEFASCRDLVRHVLVLACWESWRRLDPNIDVFRKAVDQSEPF